MSPYSAFNNSPVLYVDPDGKFSVHNHYIMTFRTLLKLGYDCKTADLLAHYASTYADHPTQEVLTKYNDKGCLYLLQPNRPGINYNKTADSQHEKNSRYHSMMSDAEYAREILTYKGSMERGMSFGWDKILTAATATMDLGDFGQGLHALQDAYSHYGRSTWQHLGAPYFTDADRGIPDNAQALYMCARDGFPQAFGVQEKTMNITMSAMIVFDLFRGQSRSLKKALKMGVSQFDFTGMNQNQLNKVVSKFKQAGIELDISYKDHGIDEAETITAKVKKK